jgi:predicted GNAT family acetyltransferase
MVHEIRQLDELTIHQLIAIADRDPIRQCFVGARLDLTRLGMKRSTYPDILGYFHDGNLESAVFIGANLIPINTTDISRQEFASRLIQQGRRCSAITGPANEVLPLWEILEKSWGKAREIRPNQPLFAISERSQIPIDEKVRYSTTSDLDLLFPACVSMFTEEVGVSPVGPGTGLTYRQRVAELISDKRSFVRIENDKVIFKAEVGTIGNGVAQIQGVWVSPEFRGQGIAAPAMAAIVRFILDDIAGTASLYANDFNKPAIATYRRVGFTQIDTFATVHF